MNRCWVFAVGHKVQRTQIVREFYCDFIRLLIASFTGAVFSRAVETKFSWKFNSEKKDGVKTSRERTPAKKWKVVKRFIFSSIRPSERLFCKYVLRWEKRSFKNLRFEKAIISINSEPWMLYYTEAFVLSICTRETLRFITQKRISFTNGRHTKFGSYDSYICGF